MYFPPKGVGSGIIGLLVAALASLGIVITSVITFTKNLWLPAGGSGQDPTWNGVPVVRTPPLQFGSFGTGIGGTSALTSGTLAVVVANKTICLWNNSMTMQGYGNNPSINIADTYPGGSSTPIADSTFGAFRSQGYSINPITNIQNNGSGKARLTTTYDCREYAGGGTGAADPIDINGCTTDTACNGHWTNAVVISQHVIDLPSVAYVGASVAETGNIAGFVTLAQMQCRIPPTGSMNAGDVYGEWRFLTQVAGVSADHLTISLNQVKIDATTTLFVSEGGSASTYGIAIGGGAAPGRIYSPSGAQLGIATNGLARLLFDNPTTGNATFTNCRIVTRASITGQASLNMPTGVAPSSPVTGDMYQDGTHCYMYLAGAFRQLDN